MSAFHWRCTECWPTFSRCTCACVRRVERGNLKYGVIWKSFSNTVQIFWQPTTHKPGVLQSSACYNLFIFLIYKSSPYVRCIDCCIVVCWSYLVGGGCAIACCCCFPYQVALMLALTLAPCVRTIAPWILAFAPCVCGVSLLSTGASIPLAHVMVSPTVTSTGGVFSFSLWHMHCVVV